MIPCPYDCLRLEHIKTCDKCDLHPKGSANPYGFIPHGYPWAHPSWIIISRNPCSGHLLMEVWPDGEYIAISWRCSNDHEMSQNQVNTPLPIEASNLQDFLNDHFGLTTETNPEPKTPLLKNLWQGMKIED